MKGYQPRTYRLRHRQQDLVFFGIAIKETDLDVGVAKDKLTPTLVENTRQQVLQVRTQLEQYIAQDPVFLKTLQPHRPQPQAPPIVQTMAWAGALADTGPMAAVAGAVAESIGQYLAKRSKEVIVENGGDIYLRTQRVRKIGIFAGASPFTDHLAIEILPHQTPLGICTSSGTQGHSLSLGQADAAVILAPSAPLADAVATATGNLVQTEEDLSAALSFALAIPSVVGALVIKNDKLAAGGQIKLVPV